MKAKEYYAQLTDCKTKEELVVKLEEILIEFANEVDKMIVSRHAKTYDAVQSVVSEVNNKWHVMVNLSKKSENKLFDGILNDDGFYLCLCELKPKYKCYFEKKIVKAKQTLETLHQQHKEQQDRINNMFIHTVMPLNEVTDGNICGELLQCMAAVGSYYSAGIPISYMKPLLERINFLQYWKRNGVNKDEIEFFEQDSIAFLKSKCE